MIIDAHTHLFSKKVPDEKQRYLIDDNFRYLYQSDKVTFADHQTLIKSMDDSGIDYAVAMGFAWKESKFCDEENRYFSKINDMSGGRILPFGSVPLDTKDVEGYVRYFSENNFFGIGEIGYYSDGLTDEHLEYLFDIMKSARKHKLPVCLHVNEPVGHQYPGKYDPEFPRLNGLFEEYSDVEIILAHWGGGLLFYELMPEVEKTFKNFYYDTAASPYLYKNEIYKIAVDIIGSEKILFGSDYPLLKFSRYIDTVNNTDLAEKDKKNILGDSAARLFRLES
jgi:predicted TIM-barrel fold metal-dependent hydrolase